MNWEGYKRKVIKTCTDAGKNDEYIDRYLGYAEQLFKLGVPIIFKVSHFADLIGYDHTYICSMAYSPKSFYRTFYIQKANGKQRRIDEPLPDLKEVQRWILDNILTKVKLHSTAKAYRKGFTIKDNARFHRKQNIVLTMDIKDFFPSIRTHDVFEIFRSIGYNAKVSNFLANLCCYGGRLPQGAPTSPYISNIRMKNLDAKVFAYTTSHNIRYTRYADDLTFSGDFFASKLIRVIDRIVYTEGFLINPQKTRVARKNARQEVTGIVVNDHMQLPRKTRRKLRQEVYYIKKFGLDSHLSKINETRSNYLRHLIGLIGYGFFLNPKDEELSNDLNYLKNVLRNYYTV